MKTNDWNEFIRQCTEFRKNLNEIDIDEQSLEKEHKELYSRVVILQKYILRLDLISACEKLTLAKQELARLNSPEGIIDAIINKF